MGGIWKCWVALAKLATAFYKMYHMQTQNQLSLCCLLFLVLCFTCAPISFSSLYSVHQFDLCLIFSNNNLTPTEEV